MNFIKILIGLIKEEFGSSSLVTPKELLQKTEDLTLILQSYVPNGYILISSSAHLKSTRNKLSLLLK